MKLLITMLLATILLAAATPVKEVEYQVFVNKIKVSANMAALSEANMTMLPAEPLFETYHYKIKKKEDSNLIIATDGYTKLEFTIGSTTAYIKGMNGYTKESYGDGLKVKLPVAPHIYDEQTYLPISFIAKWLGLHYNVDKKENKIIFSSIPKKNETKSV